MRIVERDGGFDLVAGDMLLLRHRRDAPCLFVGRGRAQVEMLRGNFKLEDRLDERIALRDAVVAPDAHAVTLSAGDGSTLTLTLHAGGLALATSDPGLNRLWLRIVAEPHERCWGGGEQMSYLDLRGRHFPLWTAEPGVGRDKTTLVTMQADLAGAGGDYWTTNYPQPTYISSRHYALHVETTAYAAFDFRDPAFHEIETWEVPSEIALWHAPSYAALVTALSARFGRQPRLPDWAFTGAIVGLKDGDASFARLDAMTAAGAQVSALWCEDWVGLRHTSFGARLFWDWRWNAARYPDLPARIAALAERGIRFLGYVNPYLCTDGVLFAYAEAQGYLARRRDSDTVYRVDFGEFDAGIVDFTNPDAAAWFADAVIGRNLLDIGLAGWMADFGEYLPTDVRLANGVDGMLMHNAWPVLWAQVNADAVASRGRTGDALFFMRAGWIGVQAHCPLLWAGDQCVDFSRHDGIGTALCGALSSGLLGNAYHHSDIGGYTSLFGLVRTPELLMRWSELAAFTPVMRSHEGNRPVDNLQLDGDPAVLAHFARMTRIHAALAPYVATLCDAAAATGLPLQRPLFLAFEDDPAGHGVETHYCYGPDLLVAPVLAEHARDWRVYLPAGVEWVHLWSGAAHAGGTEIMIPAPLGEPPVFYRRDSAFAALFAELAAL